MATNQNNDPNVGSSANSQKNSPSAATLVDTLIPVFLYAVVYFVIFLLLRTKFPRKYMPRTFMKSLRPEERTPALNNTRFGWFKGFWSIPDSYILNHHSLDGFLLLRLLKQGVIACLVGMAITWPILFPVNATGGGGNVQLDVINIGNIKNSYYRYFAHVGCAYLFFGYLLFMITRESIYYINLRQAYLLSPLYASRLSSRTVLFTSVPDEYLDEGKLRLILGESVVKRVWIATDTKELDDLVKKRDKMAIKLEGAETKLIRGANGNRLKAEKKGAKANGNTNGDSHPTNPADVENGVGHSSFSRWVNPKKRPTHRLKPLIGKKVDTIDYCRAELAKLIPEIEKKQAEHKGLKAKKVNSVFVEFTTLAEAQSAYQSLTHHQVLHMAPRFTGMTPGEVIWGNLRIKWWERVIRLLATTAFVTALVIFWSIPVAFVGFISNIKALAASSSPALSWLSFILKIPGVILGVVTGLLPSILLAVLMALLPIVLRLMAKLSGDPTLSAVELSTQNYYFAFQVVQVFLVATLSSAAGSALGTLLENPSGIPTQLATSIPKASNFYLSYFVLQGLAVVSSMLLQITGLIIFLVLGKLLDKTPRKVYKRWITLAGVGWGTVFPIYTNLFVVAICYACIAPFVLLFAAIGLFLFYLAFRYNLLFVTNAAIDTKGRVYPLALQHLFVGIYVAEVCLIGLFAIGTGSSVGALGPLILMIIFLVFTILYHMSLNSALKPLIDYLPKSLEAEERRLLEEDKLADERGAGRSNDLGEAPHQKPGILAKFLKPHIYNDYATMRRLVPRLDIRYETSTEDNAYYNPSITSDLGILWIPRDTMGMSAHEIKDTPKIIPITDEGASFDAKNHVVWDHEAANEAPIHEEKIYY
ncbi:DUF221-domain-containing protein [Myriangium duriaei CBS 260.36]|uniref:DUF221-domain-containing protein n=1 Tax=Myriangium duriaei CBS 260.36 TaxID=1168546 RepID=A0A9P4IYM3_9PEZI|nr:DUF221-domain-containing protein [Myriangium duriaei CBS 260.36]